MNLSGCSPKCTNITNLVQIVDVDVEKISQMLIECIAVGHRLSNTEVIDVAVLSG